MIVDDEHDIVDVLKMSFKRSGFRVDAFYDPIEALQKFRSENTTWFLLTSGCPFWTDLHSTSI